ncbi:uncharacterized protein BJ171DRAFT_314161 [Polychytrium aggregatum]|uniref:uncharacterized protein n=1 Tax=Polychytrium aggregatum TaxID=110093 RepID=UPI0022FE9E0E|nr:uncharacterized protein BJ171DRAFT_314161 [Polychytrium aggregatum]KAI9193062.1 hypothetical protein BJ171DRAFT_314161 [Polychytrium aggregatum]
MDPAPDGLAIKKLKLEVQYNPREAEIVGSQMPLDQPQIFSGLAQISSEQPRWQTFDRRKSWRPKPFRPKASADQQLIKTMLRIVPKWHQSFDEHTTILIPGGIQSKPRPTTFHKKHGLAAFTVGNEHGRLISCNISTGKTDSQFETKGCTITCASFCQVFPHSSLTMATGHADGTITLISKSQISSKLSLGSAITTITTNINMAGHPYLLAGDARGAMVAFDAFQILWRCQAGGLFSVLDEDEPIFSPSIRCLMPIDLPDSGDTSTSFILLCDGSPFLHFYVEGNRVLSKALPSPIVSLTKGRFASSDTSESSQQWPQVMMAGEDGAIYILEKNEIYLYNQVDESITAIQAVPAPGSKFDYLAVGGNFEEIRLYHQCQVYCCDNNQRQSDLELHEDWIPQLRSDQLFH